VRASAAVVGALAEGLLVGLLLLSPLPNGCLLEGPGDARWQTLLDVGLFLAFLMVLLEARLAGRRLVAPRPALPLVLLLVLLGFQLVPLPPALLRIVSPATLRFAEMAAPGGAPWTPVSLVPQMTLLETLRLGGYLAALAVVVNRFRTRGSAIRLAAWISTVGAAMAVLAFVQRKVAASPFELLGTPLERWGTPFGSYINKNHFAGLMEVTLAASLALCLGQAASLLERVREASLGTKLAALLGPGAPRVLVPFLAVCLTGAGLVASLSRGGWLAMGAAGGLLLLWAAVAKRSRMAWLAGIVVVLGIVGGAAVLGPGRIANRLEVQDRMLNRPRIWRDALTLTADFPVLGAGAGTFLHSFQPYHTFPDKRLATHAESDWIQTLTGVGVLGLALLAWAGLRFARVAAAGLRGELSGDSLFLAGALTGVVALVLHGFVDVNLQIPANGFHFTVLAGLVLAAAGPREGDARSVLQVVEGRSGETAEE
jgi:hypothetical protein